MTFVDRICTGPGAVAAGEMVNAVLTLLWLTATAKVSQDVLIAKWP